MMPSHSVSQTTQSILRAISVALAASIIPALLSLSEAVAGEAPGIPEIDRFIQIMPSQAAHPAGTVFLLPGASGLDIFGDAHHYHRAAEQWNARCYDAVLVDYRPAYIAGGRPRVPSTGDKIAWSVDQVRAALADRGALRGDRSILLGWSLGGEGAWVLTNRADSMQAWDAAILYYPSNQDQLVIAPQIPTLALVGTEDDVTPANDLVAAGAQAPLLSVHTFQGAQHGFDIASLQTRRVVRLLPFIGPRATLEFNAASAQQAVTDIDHFLVEHQLPSCAR